MSRARRAGRGPRPGGHGADCGGPSWKEDVPSCRRARLAAGAVPLSLQWSQWSPVVLLCGLSGQVPDRTVDSCGRTPAAQAGGVTMVAEPGPTCDTGAVQWCRLAPRVTIPSATIRQAALKMALQSPPRAPPAAVAPAGQILPPLGRRLRALVMCVLCGWVLDSSSEGRECGRGGAREGGGPVRPGSQCENRRTRCVGRRHGFPATPGETRPSATQLLNAPGYTPSVSPAADGPVQHRAGGALPRRLLSNRQPVARAPAPEECMSASPRPVESCPRRVSALRCSGGAESARFGRRPQQSRRELSNVKDGN